MISLVTIIHLLNTIISFVIDQSIFYSMSVRGLRIPTDAEKDILTKAFIEDLESFTVQDDTTGFLRPAICSVCDSIPSEPKWSCFVSAIEMKQLLSKCNMEAFSMSALYPACLLSQYSVNHRDLKSFVLSPETYVNAQNEVLVCKQCLSELRHNSEKRSHRFPPKAAITNGYVIGEPPTELSSLNDVELSLISRARIYCQSWMFFGGCHQHIKGWHTFFKNRPSDNVGNLMQLTDAGTKGLILVVLCGPFTTTQKALTLKKTAVDPEKVVKAWHWLKANNFRYIEDRIPNINDIPLPYIVQENT